MRAGNRPGATGGRRIRRRILVPVALLTVLGAAVGFLAYRHLDNNIASLPLGELGPRPSKKVVPTEDQEPLTILLLGSDSREDTGFGGETPGLSDTTIALHVDADRASAYGVSVPRDSMVQRPECTTADGTTVPGGLDLWNEAYAKAGAGCTVKQFEQLTKVPVDHVVVVDFNGFTTMVDALGGVQVCVPFEVDDAHSDIHLDEGTYEVDGAEALAYVRERKAFGDGSDLGRMRRQQSFLASMARKALSLGTVSNPVKLYRFLDAATGSVSTDPDLAHLDDLIGLAKQLRGIGMDDIAFVSIPVEAYAPNHNRVQWAPEADRIWQAMRQDTALPAKQRKSAISAASPHNKPGTAATEDERQAAERAGLCA